MEIWKADVACIAHGMGFNSFVDVVRGPNEELYVGNYRRIKTGDVKSETRADGRFHQWLENRVTTIPEPGDRAKLIAETLSKAEVKSFAQKVKDVWAAQVSTASESQDSK